METRLETRPPGLARRRLEAIVRLLTPPASREHLLGDLSERYVSPSQYLGDALRALPYVVYSRIRRTTNPGAIVFQVAFLWFGAFGGPASGLSALPPAIAAGVALVLRDAYRLRSLSVWRDSAIDSAAAFAAGALSQAGLALVRPELLLPLPFMGTAVVGFIVLCCVRAQGGGANGFRPVAPASGSMSIDELRCEVRHYERLASRSNRTEVVAGIVVLVIFTTFFFVTPKPLIRASCGLAVIGTLFVLAFIRGKAWIRPMSMDLPFAAAAVAYREELLRRQRLLRNIWWWYLLPLSLGPAVMFVGAAMQRPDPVRNLAATVFAFVVVFGGIGFMNRRTARTLGQRIEALATVEERS
jgi:hypothetical protein